MKKIDRIIREALEDVVNEDITINVPLTKDELTNIRDYYVMYLKKVDPSRPTLHCSTEQMQKFCDDTRKSLAKINKYLAMF